MSLGVTDLRIECSGEELFPAVNFTVEPSEFLTIMGPSGCGKSTLLAAISGSLGREFSLSGTIKLNGRRIDSLPLSKRRVGILFQDDLLFPHLDVYGNLAFALSAEHSAKAKAEIIDTSLAKCGLEGFANRDIATLSGGQKARISLLRSLLASPAALLLDEPFSKLDEELRASFRQFVHQQVSALNIPAILVSHDPADIIGTQVYSLHERREQNA